MIAPSAPPVPPAQWLGCHRIELEECDSTNDEAARLARAGARHGTIVIARAQRAGRGREGRTWVSPRDAGLYLSAVVRPRLPLADVPPVTLAIGVGACDAARAMGAAATLKWPNDIQVHGKKLGGILVEAHSQGNRLESIVVGIGINLTAAGLTAGALPAELAATATTLEDAAGKPVDRAAFIELLVAHVERWIDRYTASGLPAIAPPWHERMAAGVVARARINGADLSGEVAGLDRDGALLLRDSAGGLHRVRSGDVEVIRPTSVAEVVAPLC